MRKRDVDWKHIMNELTHPKIENGEEIVNLTENEVEALERFAKLVGKFNPPEDDRLPVKIRQENDVKFREFVNGQFAYLKTPKP